jgi:hypothetical protein
MAGHMNAKVASMNVTGADLQHLFCSPEGFQRGLIVKNVSDLLSKSTTASNGHTDSDEVCKLLQPELIQAFSSVWKDRNRLLNLNGWSFNTRTKAVFNQNKRHFSDANF